MKWAISVLITQYLLPTCVIPPRLPHTTFIEIGVIYTFAVAPLELCFFGFSIDNSCDRKLLFGVRRVLDAVYCQISLSIYLIQSYCVMKIVPM